MPMGLFHKKVDESPIRWAHFGADGSKMSRFVPELRPFRRAIPVDTFNGP